MKIAGVFFSISLMVLLQSCGVVQIKHEYNGGYYTSDEIEAMKEGEKRKEVERREKIEREANEAKIAAQKEEDTKKEKD